MTQEDPVPPRPGDDTRPADSSAADGRPDRVAGVPFSPRAFRSFGVEALVLGSPVLQGELVRREGVALWHRTTDHAPLFDRVLGTPPTVPVESSRSTTRDADGEYRGPDRDGGDLDADGEHRGPGSDGQDLEPDGGRQDPDTDGQDLEPDGGRQDPDTDGLIPEPGRATPAPGEPATVRVIVATTPSRQRSLRVPVLGARAQQARRAAETALQDLPPRPGWLLLVDEGPGETWMYLGEEDDPADVLDGFVGRRGRTDFERVRRRARYGGIGSLAFLAGLVLAVYGPVMGFGVTGQLLGGALLVGSVVLMAAVRPRR